MRKYLVVVSQEAVDDVDVTRAKLDADYRSRIVAVSDMVAKGDGFLD